MERLKEQYGRECKETYEFHPNVVCNERNQQIASSEFSQTHAGALFLGEYYTVFGSLRQSSMPS